jgi:glycosyltransferase involved in cell wall biosynthesis
MKINVIYKISDSPLVYTAIGARDFHLLPDAGPEGGLMLCHTMWYFSFASVWHYIKAKRVLARKNIKLVMLHNSVRETWRSKAFVPSYFCNHNLHVSEHSFQVAPLPKVYDAVYVAAAKPYKRLELAAKIKSLFVVTYFWPDVRDANGLWDLHAFEPRIRNADFNRDFISSDEVKAKISSSHTALALSAKEGAMFACQEYLLCGIPVVSTHSLGGRDVWLNPGNSVIVDDTPEAVAAGVEELKAKAIPAEDVRAGALAQSWEQRRWFYDIAKRYSGGSQGIFADFEAFAAHVWGPPGLSKLAISVT